MCRYACLSIVGLSVHNFEGDNERILRQRYIYPKRNSWVLKSILLRQKNQNRQVPGTQNKSHNLKSAAALER